MKFGYFFHIQNAILKLLFLFNFWSKRGALHAKKNCSKFLFINPSIERKTKGSTHTYPKNRHNYHRKSKFGSYVALMGNAHQLKVSAIISNKKTKKIANRRGKQIQSTVGKKLKSKIKAVKNILWIFLNFLYIFKRILNAYMYIKPSSKTVLYKIF